MNRAKYEAMLADYLGDELAPADRAVLEAYLAEHPDDRADVEELRATLAELAALQAEAPAHHTVAAEAAPAAHGRTSWSLRRYVKGVMKIAAVLALGIFIGRMTAPANPASTAPSAPPEEIPSVARTEAIHPGWIELARHLDANQAAFAVQLRSLANLRR